MLLCTSQK